MNQEDAKFQKWARWIPTILADVQGILLNRHVYQEIQGIIATNPKIHQSSVFYEWMAIQYVATSAIGVRRQLDMNPDSISLAQLLSEIKENPQVMSRGRFVAFATDNGYPAKNGNTKFDAIVGKGQAHIRPEEVEA
jgi:hypothetical protein